MASHAAKAAIIVSGRVQGVGFRARAARVARELGLSGLARNTSRGQVEIYCEGAREKILEFAEELKNSHQNFPLPASKPEKVLLFFEGEEGFTPAWKKFAGFEIGHS